jgi:hypothetical protein
MHIHCQGYRYGQETDKNLPKTSRLRRWYAGTYEDIAEIKGRHMDKKYFRGKELAEEHKVYAYQQLNCQR